MLHPQIMEMTPLVTKVKYENTDGYCQLCNDFRVDLCPLCFRCVECGCLFDCDAFPHGRPRDYRPFRSL